jgi:superfamily II DNA or RNA helicase
MPFQVISIDYIKADKRRGIFINDCPDFIIVDEAHTCALPEGSKTKSQQQRHLLLHEIASNPKRNLLLLTATPHSGKDTEFTSLLGLLKPEFGNLNFETIEQNDKKKLAKYFIQRKRDNIRRWLNEETEFPQRDSKEIGYALTPEYQFFYRNLLRFARGISEVEAETKIQLQFIEGERLGMTLHLQEFFNNNQIQYKVVLDPAAEQQDAPTEQVMSKKDQYLKMIELYPVIKNMRDQLNLDLDY